MVDGFFRLPKLREGLSAAAADNNLKVHSLEEKIISLFFTRSTESMLTFYREVVPTLCSQVAYISSTCPVRGSKLGSNGLGNTDVNIVIVVSFCPISSVGVKRWFQAFIG